MKGMKIAGDVIAIKEEVLQSMTLPVLWGFDYKMNSIALDLYQLRHILIGGASGQGKSASMHKLIVSLLQRKSHEELKLVLIDPKRIEFAEYSKLTDSYLMKFEGIEEGIIYESNTAKTILIKLIEEVRQRKALFKEAGTTSLVEYNNTAAHKLPLIVVVIDEYVDLLMNLGEECENLITNLAEAGHEAGIHIVLSTQRPVPCVITDRLKDKLPCRIAFKVKEKDDSITIIGDNGADKLSIPGEMLISYDGVITHMDLGDISYKDIDDTVKSAVKSQTETHQFSNGLDF